MDNNRQKTRSRLPRMNVSTAGSDSRRSLDSAIPRPQKLIQNNNKNNNTNKIINNTINVCYNSRTEAEKMSNNSTKYTKSVTTDPKTDSLDKNCVQTNDTTNCVKTTTSLCKSQSLNEIQYQNSDYYPKYNVLTNGCDSVRAFSFDRLDENYSNLETNSLNATKDIVDSELNLMEMSVEESSTASLGLLPNILSSSLSPFDLYNQNIPFVSIESDFITDNSIEINENQIKPHFMRTGTEGDDDSENGIPGIHEYESEADMTITNIIERPVSAGVTTNGLNASLQSNDCNNSNNSFDNTMESICSVVNQEMADEFETMNLDNSLNLKSNTDNESSNENNDMSIESNVDNCNVSENNIPLSNEFSFDKNKANNDLNKMSEKSEEKAKTSSTENSSKSIVKSLNENKSNDCNKSRVKAMKSSAVRPNSLSTCAAAAGRDPKPMIAGTEKVQRAASPSARAPVRKKIKTPGRWDAVMSKIEKSKTSHTSSNNKAIKGKINSNISRTAVSNGSLPKISPSDELSFANNDNNSSHLTPSTPSVKSGITSSTAKKNTLNSKVNIPKSKTFVRDSNGNQSTGNQRSQQPVPPQPSPSIAGTTPVTPQLPQQSTETIGRDSRDTERDTVPETDVLSNGKDEDIANSFDPKSSYTDLNDNTTTAEVVDNTPEVIDSSNVRACDSPCPSSASITSKRSDRSKVGISSLFGLFRVRDKLINDNTNEDCVSNISELSNATLPSLISTSSISKRKSNYGSRDSMVLNNEKFGFEADTRRRRRANNLLAKSSMRRSWQQLNQTNKPQISSAYILTKDRIPNHYISFSHSPPLSLSGKGSEPVLLTRSRSPQNRAKFDVLPEVKSDSDSATKDREKGREGIGAPANRTGSIAVSNPIEDKVSEDNCNEVANNGVFVVQTDEQTVERISNCTAPSDMSANNSRGCDVVVDNKVQSVVNSLDSEQNLLNDSKIIFDPKNNFKNIKSQPKHKSDKTEANLVIRNNISKKVMQTNRICVTTHTTHTSDVLDSLISNDNTDLIDVKTNANQRIEPQLSSDPIGDNCVSDKTNESDIRLKSISKSNESKEFRENLSSAQIESNDETLIESPGPPITASSNATKDIIKVKVKKNQLPESEVVCFSSQIVTSPSTVSPAHINDYNNCNNDGAVVLTFINDEPMTREALDTENMTTDILVKSTPIQGILRLRSRESNSDDNTSNGLSKAREHSLKSQKRVHFADNCLHNRNSSRGRSRIVKPRHYANCGVFASINDKKTSNRRPVPVHSTGPSLASKRMTNTKINGSNANNTKRDVRLAQLNDDKQQIQKLTQLCETKTKQLKTLGLDQNYTRLAFDSLSTVIQHLIEQYEPFENPKLKQALKNANKRCEQLKDNLDAKDVELNDMRLIFEEQINQLMKEREKNFSDLNQAKVTHESNVKKLKEMHSWEVKAMADKHNRELQLSQQNCNQLLNDIEEKNNELSEAKQSRDALELRVRQMEENIMNDKDKKFKYLTEKTKQLELEVESLKVVMDMKNEKIHSLERKMIETQEKINELPFAKESVRSLQQQIETLQITLDRKIHQFNQLTREHEDLKCEYEKEMREKRRLSMKNEELAFHLSESFNESVSGLNSCANLDSNHIRFRSPAINIDETPIKTNRSISMNSHQSSTFASNRKSHSKVNRSISTSTSSYGSSVSSRGTPAVHCPSSGSETENRFLSSDEVFDTGTGFTDPNRVLESGGKATKVKRFAINDETPPQCILDSGFEEIQGLNSLPK